MVVLQLIQAVEQASEPAQLVAAVQALVAVKDKSAISTLIAVLGYNNPTAAIAAVAGLIELGTDSVQPLMEQLDEYNYGARAYSIRALAAIGDPHALELFLESAATDFAPSVRRSAAKGLGTLHWQQLDPEQVYPAWQKAMQTLLSISSDGDWSIRYAAIVGLQALANIPELAAQIKIHFDLQIQTESDREVRSRIIWAQQVLSQV
ncbi:HEAT repeat domain-containing protein [Chlorogloea sp. CCALA 695]|uniref:HEAT repeat domain-containing protein n=1 Tax=Chlorogloea sp. CCALA 695 TaxID=2107693 RepID=UPI000D04B731|nr:HEAT repeat domain-containing protein [Chlorogloea sp. CCALA 695]PSB29672.1 phycocyanobilin lyase [Chlorogloea sp. CCALA 695]